MAFRVMKTVLEHGKKLILFVIMVNINIFLDYIHHINRYSVFRVCQLLTRGKFYFMKVLNHKPCAIHTDYDYEYPYSNKT